MKLALFIILLILATPCQAQIKEFEHIYDINMDEEIPLIWRLKEEYRKNTSDYNWYYKFSWKIPPTFNNNVKNTITRFGTIEKRLNNPTEEDLLRDLKRIPQAYYPYIGPALHNIKGLSGKILDLPGIKETKNKFPSKIASPFTNIPNIEFLSPALYIYLIPQIWGEGWESFEFPKPKEYPHKPTVQFKKDFIEKIKNRIKPADFAINQQNKTPKDGIRHYVADASTPLSPADVKAFISTLPDVKKFEEVENRKVEMIMLNSLISYWEEQQGIHPHVSYLKGVVNPCQTLVRKIKWAGLRSEFQQIIGKQSFDLDDWAYTCDKTLKAFRTAKQTSAEVFAINLLKRGYTYNMINQYAYYTPQERKTHQYFLEASLQLYSDNIEDIKAIRPYINQLRNQIAPFQGIILGTPLIIP